MSRPWHEANPKLYASMRSEVEAAYPSLHFFEEQRLVVIKGTFPVRSEQSVLGRFQVQIVIPKTFSRDLPEVRETGGRIPWHVGRHMFPSGRACLFVTEERWKHFPVGSSLKQFLDGPVHGYFLAQIVWEKNGTWPFDQRSHGLDGIYEFYEEMTGFRNRTIIHNYVDYLSRSEVKGHWRCPCGSGEKLRHCHWDQLVDLRKKIQPEHAKVTWMLFQKKELQDAAKR